MSDVAELCFQVLAAVADNGTCSLWAWEKRLQVTLLDLPKGLKTPLVMPLHLICL